MASDPPVLRFRLDSCQALTIPSSAGGTRSASHPRTDNWSPAGSGWFCAPGCSRLCLSDPKLGGAEAELRRHLGIHSLLLRRGGCRARFGVRGGSSESQAQGGAQQPAWAEGPGPGSGDSLASEGFCAKSSPASPDRRPGSPARGLHSLLARFPHSSRPPGPSQRALLQGPRPGCP